MKRIARSAVIGLLAVAVAALGTIYAGGNTSASQAAVADATGVEVYRANAVRSLGSTYSMVVGLSLPAGSYVVTGSVHLLFADQASCYIEGGAMSMATHRVSGYNEASLSGTTTVVLSAPGTVKLMCMSTKVLPMPQDPGGNATLIAITAGVVHDQVRGPDA